MIVRTARGLTLEMKYKIYTTWYSGGISKRKSTPSEKNLRAHFLFTRGALMEFIWCTFASPPLSALEFFVICKY